MTSMLLAQHADSDLVTFGLAGMRSAANMLHDAGAVAQQLPDVSALTSERPVALLAIRRDRYAFTVAMLGAWARGYDIGVPPVDVTRERFLQLAQQPCVSVVLHDTLSTAPLRIDRILAAGAGGAQQTAAAPLSVTQLRADALLRFLRFDEGRVIEVGRVTHAALVAEALALADVQRLPARAWCAASILPETRFGLVFSVFWPLLTGGAFWRDDPRRGQWMAQLPFQLLQEGAGEARARAWVTVPAHVRQCLRAPECPLTAADWLICGGSLLPEAQARLAEHRELHALVVGESARGLTVTSQPQSQDDVTQLEEQLAWLPGVVEAALLVVSDGAVAGGAAHYLAALAPDLDEAQLRASITRHLPTLTLAGVLVYGVDAWPLTAAVASFSGARRGFRRGGAGGHDRASLLRLFQLGHDGRPLALGLAIDSHERHERHEPAAISDTRRLERVFGAKVPDNYGYFEGHFPGYPILPGAAQLSELVLPCVRRARPELGRLVRMVRLKFQERILPDDDIIIALAFPADPSQVDFTLRRGTVTCASGRLSFELASTSTSEPAS